MPTEHKHRIAVIMGDGIGKEVVPEGMRALDVAAERFGFKLEWTPFPWSCEYYSSTGEMMPKNGLDILKEYESIFLGAVGYPGVPDHVSLWGLLIPTIVISLNSLLQFYSAISRHPSSWPPPTSFMELGRFIAEFGQQPYTFIATLFGFFVYIDYGTVLFNKKKRAVHDFIAGSYVITKASYESMTAEQDGAADAQAPG